MRSTNGNWTRARTHRCVLTVTLAAVIGAVALAGCGSGKAHNGAGSNGQAAGIRFAECMRSHGVPNFPDPGPGGGVQINSSSGINPKSPAFASAQNACSKLLPGPPGRGQSSEQRKLALVKLAQCMRSHGLTTFPDPTSAPPSPSSGFGLAFGAPGAFIAVPQSLLQSPGFEQAAAACGFPGRGAGGKRTPAPG